MPVASRKDVREAVVVARSATAKWWDKTAYNRGQIVYRLAEVMEARRGEFETSLLRAGADAARAAEEVSVAVDRCVYYAGFCDKLGALLASHNPVAGPHFGFSVVEPTGVVAVIAPSFDGGGGLLNLVSYVVPVLCAGNAVIALAPESDPRTSVILAECIATSDVPGGVVNILIGKVGEAGLALARHRDVDGLICAGGTEEERTAMARAATDNVKRFWAPAPTGLDDLLSPKSGQGLGYMEPVLETKSIWHPMGM
jgi:acyl-CoA reductase-like NAD-dependent aldehyde dehydrogenase